MQRWIAAVTVIMLLMGGGLIAGYKFVYKPNRPNPIWVPLQIREETEMSERRKIVKELETKLKDPKVLVGVSKDLGLAAEWKLASDDEAAKELGKRLFVRSGDMDTPQGKAPAILIGVNGKVKEIAESGKIAVRLMKDVFDILGIQRPPQTAE